MLDFTCNYKKTNLNLKVVLHPRNAEKHFVVIEIT